MSETKVSIWLLIGAWAGGLLIGLGVGVKIEKRALDHWYAGHPVKECCFPVSYIDKDSVAPAGIGKPQAQVYRDNDGHCYDLYNSEAIACLTGGTTATLPLIGTMKGGDCKSTERGPVCGNYQGAHPLKLGKRSRKEAPNVSWEPGDGPAAKTYTYAYHDCEDSKPQGDYPGHVDWTTCFDRETNKVRYQQRILTAPLMCGGADGGHPCVVPTPQVPQK